MTDKEKVAQWMIQQGYATGHGDTVEDLLKEHIITPEAVYEGGIQDKLCPFELSLDLSLYVDLIVCDYNYVFDPHVNLKRFFEDSYDDSILIIDEAHNLYARGRDYYSPMLSKQKLMLALDEIEDYAEKILTRQKTLLLRFLVILRIC